MLYEVSLSSQEPQNQLASEITTLCSFLPQKNIQVSKIPQDKPLHLPVPGPLGLNTQCFHIWLKNKQINPNKDKNGFIYSLNYRSY